MQFELDCPHVFYPGSSQVQNAYALRALLDCLISLNQAYLRDNACKPLYRSGVVYGRTTVWDTIPALYARGYGDCKSLSAALIAQLRTQGHAADPVFRWKKNSNGSTDYHILVKTPLVSNGFEDPSKKLGMGRDENAYFRR